MQNTRADLHKGVQLPSPDPVGEFQALGIRVRQVWLDDLYEVSRFDLFAGIWIVDFRSVPFFPGLDEAGSHQSRTIYYRQLLVGGIHPVLEKGEHHEPPSHENGAEQKANEKRLAAHILSELSQGDS
jgi:hypothetical protein